MNGKIIALGIGETGRDFLGQLQSGDYDVTCVECAEYETLDILSGVSILFLFATTEDATEMNQALEVCNTAKTMGILTIATVISYEAYDDEGSTAKLRKFKAVCDAMMILSFSEGEKNDCGGEFFKGLCDPICRTVEALSQVMNENIKSFLRGIGTLTPSTATDKGAGYTALKAIDAIRGYKYGRVDISSIPVLEYFRDGGAVCNYGFSQATRIIIIIAAGQRKYSFRAVQAITSRAHKNAKIICSHVLDERLNDDDIRITMLSAFGFDSPSWKYYENYEFMFMDETPESIYSMLAEKRIGIYDKDKSFGITFFEAAVRYGNAELVNLCFERGADVRHFTGLYDVRCVTPYEPLGSAIEYGNIDTLSELLRHGITKRKSDGMTAMMIASFSGREDIVSALIARGYGVNDCDKEGNTMLMIAASRCQTEVVRKLIAAGADVNAVDDYGNTPLLCTASGFPRSLGDGNMRREITAKVVDMLISAGADATARNFKGQTALMCMLEETDAKILRLLLDAGTDINAVADDGNTALSMAIEERFDLVPLMLEAGADLGLLTLEDFPDYDEITNYSCKVIRKRCEKFGLVPFDDINEALDNNSEEDFIRAVDDGLFYRLEKYGYDDGFALVTDIRYNALKNGKCDFLTEEYVKTHKGIIAGLLHLAGANDEGAEILRLLHDAGVKVSVCSAEDADDEELGYIYTDELQNVKHGKKSINYDPVELYFEDETARGIIRDWKA